MELSDKFSLFFFSFFKFGGRINNVNAPRNDCMDISMIEYIWGGALCKWMKVEGQLCKRNNFHGNIELYEVEGPNVQFTQS